MCCEYAHDLVILYKKMKGYRLTKVWYSVEYNFKGKK